MFLSVLSFLLPTAEAFCGTYVGGVGSEFYNEYSQVAIVRDGNSTVLTLVNDIQGNFDSFALVIPIPQVLTEEDVHVLEPEVFDRLDAYSQPRLVTYECEDFAPVDDSGIMFDSSTGAGEGYPPDVVVEAQYIVGEYEIVVLSADQSSSLFTWLTDNDYQVPGQSQPLLQEYIDSGSYFLAAKVAESAGIQSGDKLSPLQFKYESSVFQIPIRIGTLNSKSEQDLIIYALNPYSSGQASISNYPQFSVEDECMWKSQGEELGQYYSSLFSAGYQEAASAAWNLEYAWGGGGCDPCAGTPPDGDDLVSLGLKEEYIHYGDYFFTRLHARYTAPQVNEELMLYHNNITTQEQIRYIEYKRELEDIFPVCGEGMVSNPGSCDDMPGGESYGSDPGYKEECGGCDSGGSALLGMWLFGVATLVRRKTYI